MKAQSETLVFILLFLLSVGLFTVAVFWSKDIFQQNVDMTKVSSAEKFMKDLDYTIKSLIKFGGYKKIDYKVDGPITLIDSETIEVRTVVPSGISLPRYWNNISSDSSYIREMLDGDVFRIQLIYPKNIFDTGILCLEDGYVVQIVGDSWYSAASTNSNCNPLGHYGIDSGTGIIMAETPYLPQEDYYTLNFDEFRGDSGQIYENFSVYCGDQV